MLDCESERHHAIVVIAFWGRIAHSGSGVTVFKQVEFGANRSIRERDFSLLDSDDEAFHQFLLR